MTAIESMAVRLNSLNFAIRQAADTHIRQRLMLEREELRRKALKAVHVRIERSEVDLDRFVAREKERAMSVIMAPTAEPELKWLAVQHAGWVKALEQEVAY